MPKTEHTSTARGETNAVVTCDEGFQSPNKSGFQNPFKNGNLERPFLSWSRDHLPNFGNASSTLVISFAEQMFRKDVILN